MSGKTLRAAIIGPGGMGVAHHAAYQRLPDVEVVAVVGRTDADAARADAWGLPLFDGVARLLDEARVDVVSVCTPTFTHAEVAVPALEAGVAVICEKPLALSVAQAREVVAAARRGGARLYVAQVVQFFPETKVLRRLVESGDFGRPVDAVFTRIAERPAWTQGGWLLDREKSGLVPYDLHIHDLDLIVSLFGTPRSAALTCSGREDAGFAELCRFSYAYDGLNVVAEAGWLNAAIPFTAQWRVCFERAVLWFRDGRLIAYPADGDPVEYELVDEPKIPTGVNVPPTGAYHAELGHFLACVRAGVDSDVVPTDRVLAVLELLEAVTSGDLDGLGA